MRVGSGQGAEEGGKRGAHCGLGIPGRCSRVLDHVHASSAHAAAGKPSAQQTAFSLMVDGRRGWLACLDSLRMPSMCCWLRLGRHGRQQRWHATTRSRGGDGYRRCRRRRQRRGSGVFRRVRPPCLMSWRLLRRLLLVLLPPLPLGIRAQSLSATAAAAPPACRRLPAVGRARGADARQRSGRAAGTTVAARLPAAAQQREAKGHAPQIQR